MRVRKIGLTPSYAFRWVPCPLSIQLRQQFEAPSDKRNEAAEEGNAFDELSGQLIEMFTNPQIDTPRSGTYIGEMASNGVIIDQEMYESATLYATDIFKYCNPHKVLDQIKIQEQLDVSFIEEGRVGYADVTVYNHALNEFVIWDGKYGHSLVEVEKNYQLAIYAWSKIQQLGLNRDVSIKLRIVQPRSFQGDSPIREWVTTYDEIESIMGDVIQAANISRTPDAQAAPGLHCRNCEAAHACDALKNTVYSYLDYTSYADSCGDMTGSNLSTELRLLERGKKLVDARYDALKTQTEYLLKSGESVPAWSLEPTSGNRKWAKPIEEVKLLGVMFNIDLLKEESLITPTQAMKLKIDANVIKAYSTVPSAGSKLVFDDGAKARRIFKQEKK